MASARWGVVVVAATVACPAAGEPEADPAGAEALFQAGLKLDAAGKQAEACKCFIASQKLDVSPTNQLYVAQCHASSGRIASAYDAYRGAMKAAELRRDWPAERQTAVRARAEERMALLEPDLPWLTIRMVKPPPGLVVTQNDKVAILDLAVPVDPGKVTIRAEAPGFIAKSVTVELELEKVREVDLDLEPAPQQRSDAEKTAVTVQSSSSQRIAGWATMSSGLVSLVAATALGAATGAIVAQSDEECDAQDRCSGAGVDLRARARALEAPAWVLGGVGLAAVATGVVLLVAAPGTDGPNATVAISPAGVVIGARW